MNGKNPPASAATAPSQDGSPLTDTPVLSKLSALHTDVSSQQFKSPRLQQLLGGRTTPASSINTSEVTPVKSADSVVPADNEAGAPDVGAVEKSDNVDETLDVVEV